MENLKALTEGLRNKFFPTKEDKAWKQWVDFKDRETRDLIELLSTDVRNGFKKRALYLLVVPSEDFNTIYWKKDVGKFYNGTDFLKKLSSDQLDYVADLIMGFCSALKPMHCERPENTVEGGGGVTVFMSVPDKYHYALCFYNNCILSLLMLLPSEKIEKIFPLFSLRDISTYWNLDDASGYNPFGNLLRGEKINERWKKEADARMQAIIKDEIIGKTKPREDWENALSQYAEIIQFQLYGEINYSLGVFANQIQFIMDNRQHREGLIDNWHVIKLFNLLSGDERKELRHTIARYVVLESTRESSGFSIYSEETQQAANHMLKEFGNDPELVSKIKELEKERNRKQAESVAYKTEQKTSEDEILAQMR